MIVLNNNNNINTESATTLRSSSSSKVSVSRTTTPTPTLTIGNLFIVVVIVCITLTIVELRGFNNANQNQQYYHDSIDKCLSQPTTSRSLKEEANLYYYQDEYDEDNMKRRHPILKPRIASNSSSDLAIIVFSRRDAFDTRRIIRETWANGIDNIYFVLGGQGCTIPMKLRYNGTCQILDEELPLDYKNLTQIQINIENDIDDKLYKEQIQYRDIIISNNYIDVYRNLPIKLKSGYTFVYKYLPKSINWILKVDDDFYVRPLEFQQYLRQNYGNKQNINPSIQPLVIGGAISYKGHYAFTYGKWKEVPQYPLGGEYPPFPIGSFGHVVSRPIFEYIVKNQHLLFNYQGEDNSLGIWLNETSFDTTKIMYEATKKAMVGDGDCLKSKQRLNLVVGHNLKGHEIIWCHRYEDTSPNQRMELQVNKYDTIKSIIANEYAKKRKKQEPKEKEQQR